MTQEEILQKEALLIATFIGIEEWEFDLGYNQGYYDYPNNWSELMPVVEKIENLGYGVNILAVSYVTIPLAKVLVLGDSKIDATYKACLEFIKWYNQQQKQS